jgi:UDP-glucose 4-epimerase
VNDQPLAGRRVLITGGAGLIGSTIADLLVKEGIGEIRVFDDFSRGRIENLRSAVESGLVRMIEGDIRDRRALRAAVDGVDIIFHQAAIRITRCAEEPRLALETLVDGTFNVAEAAVEAEVAKVVPTPEDHHPYDNRTLYGAAKTFNEGMFRSFNDMYGLDYVALRYFNVYGPRMDIFGVYTEVLVRWMERIAAGKSPLILGDGLQTMDFVFSEDVARANVLAAASAASDVTLNIASGVETSLGELADRLLAVMGSPSRPEYGPERKVNSVSRRLAAVDEARELLGFTAQVDLDEGLRRLVRWWSSEQGGDRNVGVAADGP